MLNRYFIYSFTYYVHKIWISYYSIWYRVVFLECESAFLLSNGVKQHLITYNGLAERAVQIILKKGHRWIYCSYQITPACSGCIPSSHSINSMFSSAESKWTSNGRELGQSQRSYGWLAVRLNLLTVAASHLILTSFSNIENTSPMVLATNSVHAQ